MSRDARTRNRAPRWQPAPGAWWAVPFWAICSVACVLVAGVLVVVRWAKK